MNSFKISRSKKQSSRATDQAYYENSNAFGESNQI